jgi:hypothetical protein
MAFYEKRRLVGVVLNARAKRQMEQTGKILGLSNSEIMRRALVTELGRLGLIKKRFLRNEKRLSKLE